MQAEVVNAVITVVDDALTLDGFTSWLRDRRKEVIRSPIREYLRDRTRLNINIDDSTWFLYETVMGYIDIRRTPFEGPLPDWVQSLPVSKNVTGEDSLYDLHPD